MRLFLEHGVSDGCAPRRPNVWRALTKGRDVYSYVESVVRASVFCVLCSMRFYIDVALMRLFDIHPGIFY